MIRRLPTLTVLALSACSLDPHYVRPIGDAYLRNSEAGLPSVDYRQVFLDPNLQAIISKALTNNQDLRVAAANIAAAQALYRVQRSALLPQIDASARVTRSTGLPSGTGTVGTTSTTVPATGTTTGGVTSAPGGTGSSATTSSGTAATTGSGTIGTTGTTVSSPDPPHD